ncbi:hypothetical protein [Sphingopyxis flava]|uniref:hypothetical protein n=1 Tax=Sphingopyxis flava TaxID=1507287 RepID=UPI0009A55D50|nr:hypothetical protein [Sphingopyxis flava]
MELPGGCLVKLADLIEALDERAGDHQRQQGDMVGRAFRLHPIILHASDKDAGSTESWSARTHPAEPAPTMM